MQMDHARLRTLRLERGANLSNVAKVIGVSISTLSKIEHGKGASARVVKALAEFYGVAFESLLTSEWVAQKPESPNGVLQSSLLYELRMKKGVSLKEAAVATGIDPSTLSLFENGKRKNTSYPTLLKLADYYGVSPDDLMPPKESPPELIEWLWKHPEFYVDGELVDISAEGATEQMIMAVRMGAAWVTKENHRKGEK